MKLSNAIFAVPLCVFLGFPSLIQASEKFSLERMEKIYRESESLDADFLQEVYQASLARTKTSSGNLRLKKPANIRWEVYKPSASVMVSNGTRLWYYTPDIGPKGKGQVLIRDGKEVRSQPLFRILSGSSPLDKEFRIEKTERVSVGKGKKETRVTLKPRKKSESLLEVDLLINDNHLISEIFLKNSSGNTTKIHLRNQQLNAKLPSVLFDFTPPPGAEIMKNND